MSMRIKEVVDSFVKELRSAMEADMHDRLLKEREMKSYLEEREREVAEREAAWKAELSRREVLTPDSRSMRKSSWALSSSGVKETGHDNRPSSAPVKASCKKLCRKLLQASLERQKVTICPVAFPLQ